MKKKSVTFFREKLGYTVPQLAKKVGISERTLYYWESDREILKGASVSKVLKLCKVLKIKVDDII